MNNIIKLQIIKPLDVDWKFFSGLLFRLRRETRDLLNKTVQKCWEYSNFSSGYHNKFGEYPKNSEILGYDSIETYCYNQLLNTYNKSNTGNSSFAIHKTVTKWYKQDCKDILKGDKQITSYKKNTPIDLVKKSISLYEENGDYFLNLSLISKKYKAEINGNSTQFAVLVKVSHNSQKVILDRILSGEYKISASQITAKEKKVNDEENKNKWFINLSYSFDLPIQKLDVSNIMGIDLGIVNTACMAFNDRFERYYIDGGEVEAFRKKVERRRLQLNRQTKYCGDGKIGHGRKTRCQHVLKVSDKVARGRDTINHHYSKYIVDLAIKNNCGIIQMENLEGISKKNLFLKNWPYYDLQEKIIYKAKIYGILPLKINPRYTSQRCSECGYIHKDNRETQSEFECLECGFKTNADYNAAKNIATKDIENIIKKQMKKQGMVIKDVEDEDDALIEFALVYG